MRATGHATALAAVTVLLAVGLATVAVAPVSAAGAEDDGLVGNDTVVVTNVVDGDTIDVRFPDGTTDRVRFKGIDTAESGSTDSQPREYGGASSSCLKNEGNDLREWMQHLEGETVTLRYDTKGDRRGYFDRLLAYVEYRGVNYNYMLVETGRARVTTEYPMSNSDELVAKEQAARSVNRGLWRCEEASPTGGGDIDIERVNATDGDGGNLNGEYVVLENTAAKESGRVIDLSDWTIADGDGNSYTVPEGTELLPGKTLVLHTGNGSSTRDPTLQGLRSFRTQYPTDLYWGRSEPVWDEQGVENITLTGADGEIASSRFYSYAPTGDAGDDPSPQQRPGEQRSRRANTGAPTGQPRRAQRETLTGTFQGSEDGDTVTVTINGTDRAVDLVGVVWPQTGGSNQPYKKGFEGVPDNAYGGNCLSDEAEESSSYPLYERMTGRQVTLVIDPVKGRVDNTGYDANGNLHAYLYFRGEDINRKLLAEGAARMHYGRFARNAEYSAVEAAARGANRDVWRCQNAGPTGIGRIDIEVISPDPAGPDYGALNDEYIVLENTASRTGSGKAGETNTTRRVGQPVDLRGWTVSDEDGNRYTFGEVTLQPGEEIVIHTGSAPGTPVTTDADDARTTVVEQRTKDAYWGRSKPVWDNDADTVTVTASDGRVATTRSYDYLNEGPVSQALDASGSRTDSGSVFTQGQVNRVEVTVRNFSGPATGVAINDSVPEGWKVLPGGDARNSGDVRTVELGVVTREDLRGARANNESGVTLSYYVQATGSSPTGTFGPATATVVDRRNAYVSTTTEFAGTDRNVVTSGVSTAGGATSTAGWLEVADPLTAGTLTAPDGWLLGNPHHDRD